MPASEVHEAEIRERKLTRCTDFANYRQSIYDVVHKLPVYTSCFMAPEVKVQVNRDENGQIHLQMRSILQSHENI